MGALYGYNWVWVLLDILDIWYNEEEKNRESADLIWNYQQKN